MPPSPREAGLQRRALFGLLNGVDTTPSSLTAPATVANAETTAATTSGGILGGLTSAIGDVTSAIGGAVSSLLPTETSSSSTSTSTSSSTSSTSTASSSSSSSSSSSTTTSTLSPTSSSSSSSSSVSSSTSLSFATNSPAPQEVSQSETTTYLTTSDNQVITVTATLPESAVGSSSETAVATHGATSKSFLQNKAASGVVFGLVGLVGLVILVMISTWFVRRARKNRLEREAETFNDAFPDPDGLGVFPNEKITRTLSGHTTRTNGGGSDEALVGGYAHFRTLSDGMVMQDGVAKPPMGQVQQVGPSGFTPLPPPPGLTGSRQHPGVPANTYTYESPYAAHQQPAVYANAAPAFVPQQPLQHAPTLSSVHGGGGGGAWDAAPPAAPFARQHQPQGSQGSQFTQGSQPSYQTRSASGAGTPPDGRPPSNIFGYEAARNGSAESQSRASNASDAYADYAFATGPDQQASKPRNLMIANV